MRRVLSLLCMFTAAAFCVSAQSSDAIVGKWHVTGSNAEFEVSPSPTTAGQFRITLLNADDMSIIPGTVIGSAHTTPTPGRYVASMAASPSRPKGKQRKLVITIKANGSLGFEPFSTGRRISLWRWIPYLFRVTVSEPHKPPADIEGAVRIDRPDLTRHRVL